MKTLLNIRASLLLISALLFFLPAQAQQTHITLSFHNTFGSEPLVFKKEYSNVHEEKINFTLLNYFISNIQWVAEDGSVYKIPVDSSYFLVKQNDVFSQKITLRVPPNRYRAVRFTIGIDSLRSTQGASQRTGVLDVGAQARGMYWQWNSGYIFFKMEGKSPASPDSLRNHFYYHIGGYGGFDSRTLNNIRQKEIPFTNALLVDSTHPSTTVEIQVDVKKFFEGDTPLKIGQHPSIMWGPVSTQIANNYVSIFSLKGISFLADKK